MKARFYMLSGISLKKSRGFAELAVVDGYSEGARNSRLASVCFQASRMKEAAPAGPASGDAGRFGVFGPTVSRRKHPAPLTAVKARFS